jgi:hypothetical protein
MRAAASGRMAWREVGIAPGHCSPQVKQSGAISLCIVYDRASSGLMCARNMTRSPSSRRVDAPPSKREICIITQSLLPLRFTRRRAAVSAPSDPADPKGGFILRPAPRFGATRFLQVAKFRINMLLVEIWGLGIMAPARPDSAIATSYSARNTAMIFSCPLER